MKVLITCKGDGHSGSAQIRGAQLGAAIGATFKPSATLADMRAHDVVVLVKRPTDKLLADISASGARFVWDVVDSWTQPAGNSWDEKTAKAWLRATVHHVNADAVICATKQMERDVEHECKTTIYHHARPEFHRYAPTGVRVVGYEGGMRYLGRYEQGIRDECTRHGWQFNPSSIAQADVVIALRDTTGYLPRHHKSNVKLANAQALGIPALCSPESGYMETSTGGVLWIESPEQLRSAFEKLADPEHYAKVCAAVDKPPTLEECAGQYRAFLERVVNA